MSVATEPQLHRMDDWVFRYRPANQEPGHVIVILHGWRGDENSMWVLTRRFPGQYSIIAPRGPYAVQEGGYSWREIYPGTWGRVTMEEMHPVVENLLSFLDKWFASSSLDTRQFDMMGFSQGAVMTIATLLFHPERIRKAVVLSGFMPGNSSIYFEDTKISGKEIFLAHGKNDELVSVERARESARIFKSAGAQIVYCESEAGHKVSKECLREMELFLGGF